MDNPEPKKKKIYYVDVHYEYKALNDKLGDNYGYSNPNSQLPSTRSGPFTRAYAQRFAVLVADKEDVVKVDIIEQDPPAPPKPEEPKTDTQLLIERLDSFEATLAGIVTTLAGNINDVADTIGM